MRDERLARKERTILMNKIDDLECSLPTDLNDICIDVCFDVLSTVGGKVFGTYLNNESGLKEFLIDYYQLDELYANKYIELCKFAEVVLEKLNEKVMALRYVGHNHNVGNEFFLKTRFGNENTIYLIKKIIDENEKLISVEKRFDFDGENRFWSLFEKEVTDYVKKNDFFWLLPQPVYTVLYYMLYQDIASIIPNVDFRRRHISKDALTYSVFEQIGTYFKFIDYARYDDDCDNEYGKLRDEEIKKRFPNLRKLLLYQNLFDDFVVALKRVVIEDVGLLDLLQKGVYRIEVSSEEIIELKEEQIKSISSAVEKANVTWREIESIMGIKNLKRDIENKKAFSKRKLKYLAKLLNISYDYLLDMNIGRQEVKSEMGFTLVKPFIKDYGSSLKDILLPNSVDSLNVNEKKRLWEIIRKNKNWLREYINISDGK